MRINVRESVELELGAGMNQGNQALHKKTRGQAGVRASTYDLVLNPIGNKFPTKRIVARAAYLLLSTKPHWKQEP